MLIRVDGLRRWAWKPNAGHVPAKRVVIILVRVSFNIFGVCYQSYTGHNMLCTTMPSLLAAPPLTLDGDHLEGCQSAADGSPSCGARHI